MVSFMQSLRQYPEVTSSDDFIQGILDYTCTKNHNKKLWRRSLLRKSTSQHTYRVGKKLENSPTHKMNTSSRRRLDRSASVIGRRHSSQEEVLNYTYDYLKSTSLIHRRTDVRYLTEMKRAVKDRLREMIESRSTVCPKMQSRYLLHKRHCGSPKHTSDVATNITETLVPTDSKDVPHLAHGSSYTSPKHSLQKSCFCQPRTPCVCKKSHDLKVLNEIKDWINDIPVYPNFSEADKIKQDQMLKELTNTLKELLKESNFNFKAKKEILKFLKALPMWHPSDPQEDALFKEKLAENLIEKFGKAAEAILEEEIAKEIENLPLDSKYINRQDIKRMTDKFLEKLKPIAVNRPRDEKEYEEVLKSELLNLLEDVPLKYDSQKPETKSKIADKFANRLRTIKLPASKKTTTIQQEHGTERNVSEIVKDIPELSDLNASEQKELTQFLKDKMGDYDLKNLDDRQAQQEVQKKLNEWIDNSQISGRLDSKTKDKLTKKIMQELRAGVKSDDEDTLGLLKNWVQGILELSGGDETENKKYLQDLATKLNEIQLSDVDPENTQLGMRETITDWLQNMLKSNRKKLSFTTQENLVNELMKKVNDTTKQRRYMEREDPNIIYGDVIEWIKNIPGIDSNIVLDQSNVIDDLMNTLNDIRNNSDEGLAETQTTDAINNFVEHLSETMGVKIDPKKQKVLEQKLLEKNNKAPQQKKHWKKQSGYSERFSYTPDMSLTRDLIKKWTQGLKLSGGDRMENNKAVQDLATQLDEIQTSGEDPENIQIDMKETIADWLQNMLRKNNRKLSTGTQENLVSELVKNINNSPKQRRHMQIRDPNIIYDDLVEWIKDIPGMGSDIDLNQSNEIEDLMNTLKDLRNNSDEELFC
ncbi:uveal autoantigen with coiled-coil domains and ankyrin repeats-like [Maniola hyperantus]|uniref:uveal autoantigen with coiled-coil domains and ankyrin repeats-like n=1 Tax=Aphantopus hyperantus TaxID=2795564 RepID=UPI003749B55D